MKFSTLTATSSKDVWNPVQRSLPWKNVKLPSPPSFASLADGWHLLCETTVPKLKSFKEFKMHNITKPFAWMRTFVTPSKFKLESLTIRRRKKNQTQQSVKKDKGSKMIHCWKRGSNINGGLERLSSNTSKLSCNPVTYPAARPSVGFTGL